MSAIALWLMNRYQNTGDLDRYIKWAFKIFFRRNQLKKVHIDVVNAAYELMLKLDGENKNLLIDFLLRVSSNKIYLEIQKSRVTLIKSKMLETEGNIVEAVKLLQSVKIESNVLVSKEEQIDYLLEVIRLLAYNKEFLHLHVASKKISLESFKTPSLSTQKLIYYYYQFKYHCYVEDYFEIFKDLLICAETDFSNVDIKRLENSVFPDSMKGCSEETLKLFYVQYALITLLITPFQKDKLMRLKSLMNDYYRYFTNQPAILSLSSKLCSNQLICWASTEIDELHKSTFFQHDFVIDSFEKKQDLLLKAMVQHNIMVSYNFYSKVSLNRLAQFSGVDVDVVESQLSFMIKQHFINGKINRLDFIATYEQENQVSPVASWSSQIFSVINSLDVCFKLAEKAPTYAKVENSA